MKTRHLHPKRLILPFHFTLTRCEGVSFLIGIYSSSTLLKTAGHIAPLEKPEKT